MSIPLLIYIIGSVTAASMFFYFGYRHAGDGDITVMDLALLLVVALFATLLSWVSVIVILLIEYGDKVIYKKGRG